MLAGRTGLMAGATAGDIFAALYAAHQAGDYWA